MIPFVQLTNLYTGIPEEEEVSGHASNNIVRVSISAGKIPYFYKLTNQSALSRFSVLVAIHSLLLRVYTDKPDNNLAVYISLNGRQLAFPLTISPVVADQTFRHLLQSLARSIQQTLEQLEQGDILPLSADHQYAVAFNSPQGVELHGNSILFDWEVGEEGITVCLYYNRRSLYPHVARQMVTVFKQLVLTLEQLPDQRLGDISCISEEDRQLVSLTFNDTNVAYPDQDTVVSLFEATAKKWPGNIAISCGDTNITYAVLNQLTNRFAHYLRETYNIRPDDLVGIKLVRSEWMIITIIGILKAGAAYVPIDPTYPESRIKYIEQNSGSRTIIDEAELNKFIEQQDRYPGTDPERVTNAEHLAYVIYTSGTTGNPKGVMITHGALVNRLVWMQKAYTLGKEDTILQKTTYSFDVSVWELLWWCLYGAGVAVPEPGAEKDPASLVRNIEKHKVTVMHFVPSMLAIFLEYISIHPAEKEKIKSLKQVFASGEALTLHHRNTFLKELPGVNLMNLYGPTEACIDVSSYDCILEPSISTVPIGRPIDNIRLYILDNALRLQPVGVTGKLYIAGVGVARGYLNNPDLTREKFIEDPFTPGSILYDTGDIARWLPDGNIEYLGRKDHQVKIRGYRIEFGEIEHAASLFNGIRQVVADAKEINGEKVLALYYTAEGEPDKNSLKKFLQQQLPEYMIPSYFVWLPQIPLTPNGKADRKALPAIMTGNLARQAYVAPRNELEYQLAAIWEEVLKIERPGITDNFFELGGHSLLIGQVINQMYLRLSRTITFRDFLDTPFISGISGKLHNSTYIPVPVFPAGKDYPLSPAQQRLWILSQLDGGSRAYNIVAGVKIQGRFNRLHFETALAMLIERHEILRTCFNTNADGEVRQQVIAAEECRIPLDTVTDAGIDHFSNEVFDLRKAPLMRAGLVEEAADKNIFLLLVHHIISDGWSVELMIAEILEIYNNLLHNAGPFLITPSLQYKDYVLWQQERKLHAQYAEAENYWLAQFQGDIPQLSIPAFKKRPAHQSFNGATCSYTYPAALHLALQRFSQQHQASLFMTLMTAVNALLYRYTGQHDIILGTAVAGRRHPDLENGIGLFLNTLAIRTQVREDWTFTDLLQEEKQQLANAYTHQEYPFDELISRLQLKPDRSRSALFDVMVVLHNQFGLHLPPVKEDTVFTVDEYKIDRHTSHFDMTFSFMEKEGLELAITYNTDIYDERMIENIFSHLDNIFGILISAPDSPVAQAVFLSTTEQHTLLHDFNNTAVPFPQDKTWLHLFREQAASQPYHIAVKDSSKAYTYRQLDTLSDNIARHLQENAPGTNQSPVAVMLDRSADMVLLLLSIQKAGRPYIPLDPSFPADRLDYVMKDSGVDLLVAGTTDGLQVADTMKILALEELLTVAGETSLPPFAWQVSPEDTAYIIYTSGSTGNPKGIEIGHRSLLNLLTSMTHTPGLLHSDTVFAVTSYSFDISVADFFTALIAGATLYIAEQWLLSDPPVLIRTMDEVNPTFIQATPSFYQLLRDNHWQGRSNLKVLCGGDVFSDTLGAFLLDNCKEVWNMYGPTETTVYSCMKKIEKPGDVASIGKPINNTSVYLLDSHRQPVPVGVIGNMYVAGAALAKGYYRNEALTLQKFVQAPFNGDLLYETGDVAKWDYNGDIIFLGRNDHQVKIRGFRVELGEIESQLVKLPGIRDAVVLLNKDLLVAYLLTGDVHYNKEAVVTALKQKLVHYMIPQVIIPLPEFPLTPSRKIDRKALLRIPLETYISHDHYTPPAGPLEERIVKIWKEVLGLDRVGVTDNFFELGGNSIKAFRVINLINQQYASMLKIRDVLDAPVIRDLAMLIEMRPATAVPAIRHLFSNGEKCMLSSNQRRLWILDNDADSNAYNITNGILTGGNFNPLRFANAYTILCQLHESFRTSFAFDTDVQAPVQYVKENPLPVIEWETYDIMPARQELIALLNKENNHRFDLSIAPLSKLKIITLPGDRYFVIIVMHHLISDAWSMDNLLKEWISLYQDPGISLVGPGFSYRDFTLWQQQFYSSEAFGETVTYWNRRLEKYTNGSGVLLQQQGHPSQSDKTEGATVSFSVDKQVFGELRRMAERNSVSLFSTMLTSFSVLLYHISGKTRITLGTSVAGRPQREFEPIVGFFINTIPISLDIDPSLHFKDLLQQANRHIINDIQHGDISLDELLLQLNRSREGTISSLFQGRFVFSEESFDAEQICRTTGISSIERMYPDQADVKFDFSLTMKTSEGNLSGVFEFRTAMYDRDFIELVIHCYCRLLEKITSGSETVVEVLNSFGEEYAAYQQKKNESLQDQLFDSFSNFKKHNNEKQL